MVKRLRHRPFTAVTGVQIPLESSCERENEIFERHAESNVKRECADVAQLAEQLICNQQVNGSSPFIGFLGKRKSLRKAKDSEVMNDDLKGILERQFANSVCSLSFALQMTLPFLINLYKQACKVH